MVRKLFGGMTVALLVVVVGGCHLQGETPAGVDQAAPPETIAEEHDGAPTAEGLADETSHGPGEPVSLKTLAGTEWVLRAWARGEPAPAEPEVTLVVEEGRLAGSNGCNRYFADAVEGDAPGAVAIGPTGSTKIFCPDPAGAVEARFMARLAGVTRFGFIVGQLALSYDLDGAHDVMLFDARTPPGDP